MLKQQTPMPAEPTTIEAPTLEEALSQVAAALGPDAEIVEAQKVHRGGVGGFFAKEVVQLTARPAEPSDAPDPAPATLDELVSAADDAETGFHELFKEQLEGTAPQDAGDDPAPVAVGPLAQPQIESATAVTASTDTFAPSAPASVTIDETVVTADDSAAWIAVSDSGAEPAAPVIDGIEDADWRTASFDAPVGYGRVQWSATSLARIGLPPEIVEPTKGLDPDDDLAWINAVAAAVAPLCGELPDEPVMIVGTNADRLAEPLDVPLVNPPDMPPYSGSVAAVVSNHQRDIDWLQFVKGDRRLHLVVGDEPWRDLLIDDPVAVSWTGEQSVVDAVYLATTLDGVLAYGTTDGFVSGLVRVRPIDVALAIRRLVGRS